MKLHMALIGLIGLGCVASCDAVRVPTLERPDTTEAPEDAPEPPPRDEASVAPDASEPAPTQTAEGPRPIDEPIVTPEPEPAELVYRLADINAATCGLPEEAEPTPTIAQISEWPEDQPRPESFLQTQVVGVTAAVASLDPFPGLVKMEPVEIRSAGIEAKGHCGATRISERWFLTAAHCIDQGYDEIRFIAGTTNLRDSDIAQTFRAEAAICHAGYRGQDTQMINDIALIQVSEETVPLIRNIPTASYGAPEEVLSAENYATPVMAGWGTTSYGSLPSDLLLSAELNLISASPGVIVVESANGQGPCEGDSGGPLYVTEEDGQRRVIGVLSNVSNARTATPCSGTYRGNYTNVGGYADWIDTVMSACEANPALCRN